MSDRVLKPVKPERIIHCREKKFCFKGLTVSGSSRMFTLGVSLHKLATICLAFGNTIDPINRK